MAEQNGTASVVKWLLGILAGVIGGIAIITLCWMVSQIVSNMTEIRLIKLQINEIERRLEVSKR